LAATLGEPLTTDLTNQAWRTALDAGGDWIPAVLRAADQRLTEVRRHVPDAGAMVIASDQNAARAYARLLHELTGVRPTVVLSDDKGASAKIGQFSDSEDRWLVAVRMVSEGVDIPRLRVGVFATTTSTELFFRQAVGRLVRWTRGVTRQRAWLFIPDDPRLRRHATQIAQQRRHSLARTDSDRPERDESAPDALPADEQLSLFAAISAVATGSAATGDDDLDLDELSEAPVNEFEVTLAPPPPLAGAADAEAAAVLTRREEKALLRELNADLARRLARRTALTHAQVNAELNRLSGVRRVSQATIDQLQARLRAGDVWLAGTRA
jgi:superfamily II DNA or RNA helicase